MQLLLMRHAAARPGLTGTPHDPCCRKRWSSCSSPPRLMRAQLAEVERLVTSPWLRARQTGAALLPFCPRCAPLECSDALLPDASVNACLALLESLTGLSRVLLVGHQPLLGRLAALLCDGPGATPLAPEPGEMAVIELDWPAAGLGRLRHWQRLMN